LIRQSSGGICEVSLGIESMLDHAHNNAIPETLSLRRHHREAAPISPAHYKTAVRTVRRDTPIHYHRAFAVGQGTIFDGIGRQLVQAMPMVWAGTGVMTKYSVRTHAPSCARLIHEPRPIDVTCQN
jgi:hypothetical protein